MYDFFGFLVDSSDAATHLPFIRWDPVARKWNFNTNDAQYVGDYNINY